MMIRFFNKLKPKIDKMTKKELCFELEYFISKLEKSYKKLIDIDFFLT